MEWIERLNSAISYIEEHLEDEIDYEHIAKNCLLFYISFPKNVFLYSKCTSCGIYSVVDV